MKLEKVSFYSMIALVGGFVAREVLKASVRVRTMAIRRSLLQLFYDDPSFKALYFNPSYDNRLLTKDVVALLGYKEKEEETKRLMDDVFLEAVDKGILFDNEIDYSVYRLTKPDLKHILDSFSDASKVIYVLFKPVPYPLDKRYLAYELIPADWDKNLVPLTQLGIDAEGPAMAPAQPPTPTEAGTSSFVPAAKMGAPLRMNPSPPATMDLG